MMTITFSVFCAWLLIAVLVLNVIIVSVCVLSNKNKGKSENNGKKEDDTTMQPVFFLAIYEGHSFVPSYVLLSAIRFICPDLTEHQLKITLNDGQNRVFKDVYKFCVESNNDVGGFLFEEE